MSEQSIQKQLDLLDKMYKRMDAIYHMAALNFGISDSVLWVLYVVSDSDTEYTQYSLCNDWFYSKQTINSAIKSLVNLGYIYLSETKGCRNQKVLKLTDEGKKFAEHTVIKLKNAEFEAFAGLSEDERKDYLRLSEKYLQLFYQTVSKIK